MIEETMSHAATGAAVASGAAPQSTRGAAWLVPFVVLLFFAWGFTTVLLDSLIPKLKGLFALNYAQATLTTFAFFIAYFIVSVPAGWLMARIGYLKTIVVGLIVMIGGCLLFSPAASAGVYWGFLGALFIVASGITTLQVAANPLIAILGKAGGSHFRLNLAQALNSLGTFIGPFVGAAVILKNGVTPPDPATTPAAVLAAYRTTEANAVQAPFLAIAAGLGVLALVFWLVRNSQAVPTAASNETGFKSFALLRHPRLLFGVIGIFLYVGAEVTIGGLMVNYLMQPKILDVTSKAACAPVAFDQLRLFYPCIHTPADAGKMVAFYWLGAMVGRIVGSILLFARMPAGRLLTLCAIGGVALVTTSIMTTGWTSAYALIAVGLVNSIMFPTIFTLAIEGRGADTSQASSLLCMAIVGGAAIPYITGHIADRIGLSFALFLPVACYVLIALYGWFGRAGRETQDAPVVAVP
jgi:FHS family L-fucose permease-like MFS transporter